MSTTTRPDPKTDGSAALAPAPTMRGLQAVPFTLPINGVDHSPLIGGTQAEQSA